MKRAKEAVANGHSVVIGLQSTGESHTRQEVNRYSVEPEEEKRDDGNSSGDSNEIDDGKHSTNKTVDSSSYSHSHFHFITFITFITISPSLILLELHIVDGFISSPKAVLLQLLNKGFPSIVIPEHLMHVTARDEDEIEEITAADGSRELIENT